MRGILTDGECERETETREQDDAQLLAQSRSGFVLHEPVVSMCVEHAAEARACVSASPASFSSPCVVAPRGARWDSTSLHAVGPQYVKSSVEDVGTLKCRRGRWAATSWMSTYGRTPTVASARMGGTVLTEHTQSCKNYAAAPAPCGAQTRATCSNCLGAKSTGMTKYAVLLS